MNYLGDYTEDDTVYFLWSTNDGSGASITRATDGTVSVYKDNGLTQSTAGITGSEDFDSLTGIHSCTIDLSADAFYATGGDYAVVLSGSTIDGQSVNAVLAHFSIQNRHTAAGSTPPTAADIADAVWDEAIADHATGTTFGGKNQRVVPSETAADYKADVSSLSTHSAADVWSVATRAITDKAGFTISGTKTTLDALNDVSAADVNAQCDIALSDYGGSTHDAAAVKTAIEAGGSSIAQILADTNELQANQGDWATATGFSTHDAAAVKTAIEAAGSHLAQILEDTGTTLPGTLSTISGKIDTVDGIVDDILVDTGTTLDGKIDNILTDTGTTLDGKIDGILTDTGTTLDGKLDNLLEALVYKQIITEANGDTEIFNASNVSQGTVSTAFTTDGTYTQRLKLVV